MRIDAIHIIHGIERFAIADLSITPANVLPVKGATIDTSLDAGETLTQGMAVYKKTTVTPNVWMKAKANGAKPESGDGSTVGINLGSCAVGQPAFVLTEGDIDIGATCGVGKSYWVSENYGGIQPTDDIEATINTDYSTFLGSALTAARIRIQPLPLGVKLA